MNDTFFFLTMLLLVHYYKFALYNFLHRNEAMPPVVAVSAHVISNVHLILKKLTSANTARYASATCFCKQHPRAANISNKQRGRRVIYTSHRNNKLQAPHQATVSEQKKKKKVVKAEKEKATHTINNKKGIHNTLSFYSCQFQVQKLFY